MTGEMLKQIVMGAAGSLGFALLFNMRGRVLFCALLGGALGWTTYLLLGGAPPDDLRSYLFAAMAATLYAEVLARAFKMPVTPLLVCSVIPLIPGGSLYYTMAAYIQGDYMDFSMRGAYTLSIAVMLALGMMAVMMLMRVYATLRRRRHG